MERGLQAAAAQDSGAIPVDSERPFVFGARFGQLGLEILDVLLTGRTCLLRPSLPVRHHPATMSETRNQLLATRNTTKTALCRVAPLLALTLSAAIGLMGCGKQSCTDTTQCDLQTATKAAPGIARLDAALANREKFQAEDILAELENLIPSDPRMAALRDKVAALPGPKKNLSIDLGGGVTMEFVLIRPGSFIMGSDKSQQKEDKPAHKVTITKPFYLGKYEVTQEQWEKVMGSNPSIYRGPKRPVERVNWDDCQSFLAKLREKNAGQKFALPTEAQWEYACRAGSTGDFCYGDGDANLGEYAWYVDNSGGRTYPVGEKRPNAWGLNDMHGNVWEWCNDAFGSYSSEAVSDPMGASSGAHVLRGGGWCSVPDSLRSACRINDSTEGRFFDVIGFRCVLLSESVR